MTCSFYCGIAADLVHGIEDGDNNEMCTEEMEKFTIDSIVEGYTDCGNECPKCGM